MKFVIAALLALCFVGCSSAPNKIMMKNCKKLSDDFYSCDEIPQKNVHEFRGGRFN